MKNDDSALRHDAPASCLIALIDHFFLSSPETAHCTGVRPYLVGVDMAAKIATVFQPDCRTWSCPYCADMLKKEWMLRAMLLVNERPNDKDFDFVTVTSSNKNRTFAATLRVLPDAWSKLYQRMKRYDREFEYVVVPELHKNGRVHLHMITDFETPASYYVHRRERSNTQVRRVNKHGHMDSFWRSIPPVCGFGYICDQEALEGDATKAAGYVAKYLTKQANLKRFPQNFKHIRASHGVPRVPDNGNALANFDFAAYMDEREAKAQTSVLAQLGYRFVHTATGEYIGEYNSDPDR